MSKIRVILISMVGIDHTVYYFYFFYVMSFITLAFNKVLGDLIARVGNEVIEGIVGPHEVPGSNESGKRLLEMCAKQELVVGNSRFKKKVLHKI